MSFHRPFFLFGSFQKFVHELFSRIGVRIFYSLKQFGHANVEVWLCNDSGSIFSMNDSYIDVSRLIRSRRFVSYVFGSVATHIGIIYHNMTLWVICVTHQPFGSNPKIFRKLIDSLCFRFITSFQISAQCTFGYPKFTSNINLFLAIQFH